MSRPDARQAARPLARRRQLLGLGAALAAGLPGMPSIAAEVRPGAGAARAAAAAAAVATPPGRAAPRVVVVGGGWGGSAVARHIRLWSGGRIGVTLVEPEGAFVSCPLSNLVLSGTRSIGQLTFDYRGLAAVGVERVHDRALAIDPEHRTVRLARGDPLSYDRLVLAPGLEMNFEEITGYTPQARTQVLHAYRAGPDTIALRRQIEAMPEGGVFILAIPMAPFKCPPSPYERACQVALHLQRHNPRGKVLILDANESIVSKAALFTTAFKTLYPGLIEYVPNAEVRELDAPGLTVKTDFDSFKGDVLNVLPPMRAAGIAATAGLVTANGRWCGVDWLSMASTVHPDIHVLGDATLSANLMPKSGHMANQHAKIAAAAISAELTGGEPPDSVQIANTCYSYMSDRQVAHVASVHRWDPDRRELLPVPGAGGLSPALSDAELPYAQAWARNIWADTLG
jgi:NADH dehydrogenase FAD-containing subunit